MKIFGLETTGSFTGDISGSATSTGSFGNLITGNSRVGIGTTSLAGNLTVQTTAGSLPASTAATGTLTIGSVSSTLTPSIMGRQTSNTIGLYLMALTPDANTSGDMEFNVRENNNSTFSTTTNSAFKFSHVTTDLVDILRNGNVGIGTTSPGQKLTLQGGNMEITGSGGSGIFFTGTSDGSNKNALYFRTQGGTEKFRFIHDASADNTNDFQIKSNASSNMVVRMLQNGDFMLGNTVVNPASGFSNQKGFGYDFSTGQVQIASSTNTAALQIGKNQGTAGDLVVFRHESVSVGAIDTAGGISGSATSTGSFGRGHFAEKVGIGVSDPVKLLTLGQDAADGSQTAFIEIIDKDTDTTADTLLEILWSKYHTGTSDADVASIGGGIEQWSGTSSNRHTYMDFRTVRAGSRAEKMRITSEGKVGIGTTNPAHKLDVVGDVRVRGDLTAETLIISSSVTNLTTQFASGSTRFGDDQDDIHEITGSIYMTGSRINISSHNPALNLLQHGSHKFRLELASNESYLSTIGSNKMYFRTNQTEAFRIDTSQNVILKQNLYVQEANKGIYLGTTNSRLYFGSNRALEANDGTNLQLGENYEVFFFGNNNATDYKFLGANALISGSVGSTGSFGKVFAASRVDSDKLSLGTVFGSDHLGIQPAADGTNVIQVNDHDGNALFRLRDSSAAALMNLYDGGTNTITLDADSPKPSGNGKGHMVIGNIAASAGSGSNSSLLLDGGNETTMSLGMPTYANNSSVIHFREGVKHDDMITGMEVGFDGGLNFGFIKMRNTSDNNTYTTTNVLKMARGGEYVEFPTANVKVSGSATSTGSFGQLVTSDKITAGGLITTPGNVQVGTAGSNNFVYSLGNLTLQAAGGYDLFLDAGAGADEVTLTTTSLTTTVPFTGSSATFSGNVEIISSNASNTKLLIENNHSSANAILQIDSTDDRDSVIQLLENGTTKWDIRNDGNDSDKLKISDDGDVRLTLDQSGNVGIGTTSPSHLLHVDAGSDNAGVLIQSTSNTGAAELDLRSGDQSWSLSHQTDGDLVIYDRTRGAETITFKSGSGNVGIGNTNPVQPLTVTGNISGSGRLQIHDQGASLAATIRATDPTNGYGLAVESEGTANTRYNVIFRNLDASTVYGGIATKSGQVGFWGVGVSPAATLGSRLNVNGNVAIGTNYTDIAAPSNGMIVEGRLGIGNTNPSSSLHIGDELTNNNGSLTIAGYNSNIRTLFEPGTDTMHFKMFSPSSVSVLSLHKDGNVRIANGNLGVGTEAPTERVTVTGNISGSGHLKMTGAITGSTVKTTSTKPIEGPYYMQKADAYAITNGNSKTITISGHAYGAFDLHTGGYGGGEHWNVHVSGGGLMTSGGGPHYSVTVLANQSTSNISVGLTSNNGSYVIEITNNSGGSVYASYKFCGTQYTSGAQATVTIADG